MLTRADEMLLVCILVLGNDAFSTTITSELHRRTRKRITVGSLWVALDQLATKGLIEKQNRPNPDRKGGRPRVYYFLTKEGLTALRKTRDVQTKLWKGVPDLDTVDVLEAADSAPVS